MVGRAPNPVQTIYPNRDRLKVFALDGTFKAAADPLADPTGSLWAVLNDSQAATGPLMAFGDEIVPTLKNFDVALVPSAKGATSMEQWARDLSPATLYGAMIERANEALAAAPHGSFIAGFIWQQGESDTFSEASALGWPDKFAELIENVRSDLALADLPVIMIGLGPAPGSPFEAWDVLNGIQRFMSLPSDAVYIPTNDLSNVPEDPDWKNTTSVIEIGRRAARAMRPMLPPML